MGDLNTPAFSASIQQLIDASLLDAHISMPARVESYDASQQRVAVKPIIRRPEETEDGTAIAADIPVIEGVPVIFLGAGAHKITFPIAQGDLVWLVFGECSLDKWLTTGANDVDPDDPRRNAISDAVAFPGILPFANASDQYDGAAMVISAPEIKLGSKDASAYLALKSDLDRLLAVLKAWTPVAMDGGAKLKTDLLSEYGLNWTAAGTTKVKAE